jgi:hypothetical protein
LAAQSLDSRRTLHSVSLQRLLELTPLSPAEVVYVTLAVLHQLPENQGAELWLPTPRDVRITDEGAVLVDGHSLSPPAAGADAVSAVGQMLVPALAAQDPLLEVALDSLAMGALGRAPAGAALALSHQLPGLASPDARAQARADLAAFVRRLHAPGVQPPLRQPSSASSVDGGPQPPRALIGAGVVMLVILAILMSITGVGAPSADPKVATSAPAPAPSALQPAVAPTPLPAPAATAVAYVPPAPPSLGRMRGVALNPGGNCQVGGRCSATVDMRFAGAGSPTALAWKIVFYDGCDGTWSPLENGSFAAPAGWNHVISDASVAVPASLHRGRLVAVTSSPNAVASDPVEVSGPDCP